MLSEEYWKKQRESILKNALSEGQRIAYTEHYNKAYNEGLDKAISHYLTGGDRELYAESYADNFCEGFIEGFSKSYTESVMQKMISQWKAYSFLVEKLKELDRLKELPYAIIDFEYFENLKSEFGYQET